MVPEIVGVRIGQVAVRTNEGTDMSDKVMLFVYAGAGSLLGMSLGFFVFDNVFVLACYRIKTHPDWAEFCEGAEEGASQLIDIVVELIGAGDEFALGWFDCQLYLAKIFFVEEDVN